MSEALHLKAKVTIDSNGNVARVFVHDGKDCCSSSLGLSIDRADITVEDWSRPKNRRDDE